MLPDLLLEILPFVRKMTIRHPDGSPYITRWILWGCSSLSDHDPDVPSSAYVHRLHTLDKDQHMHDHPWSWAVGIVLSGGYTERRRGLPTHGDYEQTHKVGDINLLRHRDYHTIVSVLPDTYTLFLVGREISDWGFLVNGRHVPHREYLESSDANHYTHTEDLPGYP